jgi:hypothetical protein
LTRRRGSLAKRAAEKISERPQNETLWCRFHPASAGLLRKHFARHRGQTGAGGAAGILQERPETIERKLGSLTTGQFNSAFGFLSLLSNGAASFNTGVDAGTLLFNTADQNTAVGAAGLFSNTTGSLNTAVGVFALFNNVDGSDNNAVVKTRSTPM